jgi:muconolactone delta-isomerase
MRHINALLNPTQSRNLQKALDLAIWEVAGNKNKYLFTVEDIEELKEVLL